jgi:hypothetical protein
MQPSPSSSCRDGSRATSTEPLTMRDELDSVLLRVKSEGKRKMGA